MVIMIIQSIFKSTSDIYQPIIFGHNYSSKKIIGKDKKFRRQMRMLLRIQIFIESNWLFIRLIIKIYYQDAKLYVLIRVEYLLQDSISMVILTLILN